MLNVMFCEMLKPACRLLTRKKLIVISPALLLVLLALAYLNNDGIGLTERLSKPPRNRDELLRVKPLGKDGMTENLLLNEHENILSCETIHVAVVAAGYNASREAVRLIKSILFHRRHPLHMHFIVDTASKKVLSTLFRTWDVPDLTVSFYLSTALEPKVSWITNFHYSGVYGLLKLVISDALPSGIDQVIILDIDIVFLADIGQLWKLFSQFSPNQVIGLVENQSDWYLGNITYNEPWPAVGRGYNTGVMLIDREKLQGLQWDSIWTDAAKKGLRKLNGTILADQDIINAVVKEKRSIVFNLPCFWNIQLSMNTRSALCYGNDPSQIKVLHWNAPRRQKTKLAAQSLYQHFHSFSVFDGALLRNPVGRCHKNDHAISDATDEDLDFCQVMLNNVLRLRRIHLFYFPFHYESGNTRDVTLVAHLSMDRMPMLSTLAKHWQGPISVAIYLSDPETVKLYQHVTNSPILETRTNIGYHLVFQDYEDTTYPINIIRNVALQQAATEFVFLCDIDFAPSKNLYDYLISSVLPSAHAESKTAFVVPAFEHLGYKNDFPGDKSELLEQWEEGTVTPFRMYLWPAGHNATNYTRWRHARMPYYVPWTKDYEPYVVISKKLSPSYDKRFFGFGWNKVSLIMELDAVGFQFSVLPYGFVIHMPHMPSIDIAKFRSSKEYRDCVAGLKSEFVAVLASKYGIDSKRYSPG